MKKLYLAVLEIMIVSILCSCSRERIVIEQKPDNTDAPTECVSEGKAEDSSVTFRPNPFGEIDPPDKCCKMNVFFYKDETKEAVSQKWNSICNLSGVKRTKLVTMGGGTFFVEEKYVNPLYLEYYLGGDEEIRKFVEKNGLEFTVTFYASDDVDEITMCMYKGSLEGSHWKVEEWPFYIEENDVITLRYNNDWQEELQYQDITVQKITSELPWYLNTSFDNTQCMIIFPVEKYREIFGEDHDDKNIQGLDGSEWFYVQCEEGKLDEVRKEIEKIGVHEICNTGFYKED